MTILNFTQSQIFPVLGKRLGKKMGYFTELIKKLSSKELKKFEETASLILKKERFSKEEIEVLREPIKGKDALSNGIITIDIDCKLNQSLINEGAC